jgi:hypothetical protein
MIRPGTPRWPRKPGSRYQWVKDDKRQQLLQAERGEALATAERPA